MLAETRDNSPMIRNSIGVVAGVLLSFALSVAGARLTWLLIVGNVDRSENKGAIINWMLVNTFAVGPAVAIIVGAFVGFIAQRSAWWLGGVTVLPLFIYGDILVADRIEIGSSVVFVALAFAAAFVVSRFKRPLAA